MSVSIKMPVRGEIRHLAIDSTGLKVFGEGEWHMKKLGKDKRRVWRKLHIAVDADTHQIVVTELPKSAAKYILGIVLPKVIQHHDVIDDSGSEIANEIFDLIPE